MSFTPLFRNILLTGVGVVLNFTISEALNDRLGTKAYFLALYDPSIEQKEKIIQLAKFVGLSVAITMVAAFIASSVQHRVDEIVFPNFGNDKKPE